LRLARTILALAPPSPQDPDTGLPEHRKAKLLDVFRLMDKVRVCAW